jgi:cytochrome P450
MSMVARGAHPDYVGEQAIKESVILFVASVGTSTQSIVNTVADLSGWFESHPEDYARRADHDFLLNAIQESLRLRAPFVPFMLRVAARDTEIAGCPVQRGQEIHIPLQVANRDPAVWGSNAHNFDPWRVVPDEHRRYGIAFGVGEHQCLGLRVVMGSDGTGGAHIRVLQRLFEAGVRPDPANPAVSMEQVEDVGADEELPRWVSYPTVLADWHPEDAR